MIPIIYIPHRLQVRLLFGCTAVAFVCAIVVGIGYAMNAGYEATDGTVVRNITRTTGVRKAQVCPRIKFQDHKQVAREFTAFGACTETARYQTGDNVTVYFMKEDPAYPNTTAPDKLFNTMIAALILGFLCLIAAFIIRRRGRSTGRL
jgi:hypothetical protein